MPHPITPDAPLRAAMQGVRGLLLDMDGVLTAQGAAVPGAADAMAELDRRGLPYLVLTNSSLISRVRLARWTTRLGFAIPADRFITALSASVELVRREFADRAIFVICSPDARTELDGLTLLAGEDLDADPSAAAAVILGASPDELTKANLDRAFRAVRSGAELIGMHRNPWWLTQAGPTLDAGAFLVGLEYATGRRARIVGKPSRSFFTAAVDRMAGEAAARGEVRLRRGDLAMVGDDMAGDVGGARKVGLRTVFVRTGKHGDAELAAAASRSRGAYTPDAVAPSIAEVVAALRA